MKNRGDCLCIQLLQLFLTLQLYGLKNPPVSFVHGILYARILEWVATPSSTESYNSGMEPVSPVYNALKMDSLLIKPLEKPPAETVMLLFS